MEVVLSGAGGCRLGLVGGLLADVHGLGLGLELGFGVGLGFGLGDGVGVFWWGVGLLVLDGGVHVDGGVGRTVLNQCTHSAVVNSTSSMPCQGPLASR
ncbi:MAG: hypothetical protein E7Z94_09810 [Actinomyces ruminicola]|nr:hypothetical protein [Actinomyces ruminicola]